MISNHTLLLIVFEVPLGNLKSTELSLFIEIRRENKNRMIIRHYEPFMIISGFIHVDQFAFGGNVSVAI